MARKKELPTAVSSGGKADRKAQQYSCGGATGAATGGKKRTSPSPPGSPPAGSASSAAAGGKENEGSYFSPGDKNYIRFRAQLAQLGLEMKDIPGDG